MWEAPHQDDLSNGVIQFADGQALGKKSDLPRKLASGEGFDRAVADVDSSATWFVEPDH
jgi:hypothetical protein